MTNQNSSAASSLSIFPSRADIVLGIVSEHNYPYPALIFASTGNPIQCVVHRIYCTNTRECQVDNVAVSEAVLAVNRSVSLLKHVHDVSSSRFGAV